MRLIDADALNLDYEVETADDWKTAHEIANVIKYAPTVDAVQVRHGKWIRTGRKNIYGGTELVCNLCKDRVMVQDVSREHYCRNCGAKMEESDAAD